MFDFRFWVMWTAPWQELSDRWHAQMLPGVRSRAWSRIAARYSPFTTSSASPRQYRAALGLNIHGNAIAHPSPPLDFLILEKTETDRPLSFRIFKNRNTHLYRLGAKSTPGTGDFDDMGRGDDHL